jgi:putative glutathione S-transferase
MLRLAQVRRHINMSSISTFKDGAWHGKIEAGGQFPPEKGRYHLYIGTVFHPYNYA